MIVRPPRVGVACVRNSVFSLDHGISADQSHIDQAFGATQDWPTLLWNANFGCIELIPWNSRVGSLDQPNNLVIDLDPDVPFLAVEEAALAIRKIFDQTGVESFCKTSGKRGFHVYVPMGKKYSHEQAKTVSELVARTVNRQLPATTSLDIRTEKRRGLIYLDRTRNAQGQAMAVAYCARPHPGATVSCPLRWSEVNERLKPLGFYDQDNARTDRQGWLSLARSSGAGNGSRRLANVVSENLWLMQKPQI